MLVSRSVCLLVAFGWPWKTIIMKHPDFDEFSESGSECSDIIGVHVGSMLIGWDVLEMPLFLIFFFFNQWWNSLYRQSKLFFFFVINSEIFIVSIESRTDAEVICPLWAVYFSLLFLSYLRLLHILYSFFVNLHIFLFKVNGFVNCKSGQCIFFYHTIGSYQ